MRVENKIMITKHDVKIEMESNGATSEQYNTVFTEHDGSTDEETTVQYESIEDFYEAKPELKSKIVENKDFPSSPEA
jgi:hypothetical protein